jgi:3-phosphoshikimate 1-carboxyvinyltransferase
MSDLTIAPLSAPFVATVTPSGSKSLTNRALVLAALSEGRCHLSNVLFADDTRVMIDSLRELGFQIEQNAADASVIVHGRAGKVPATDAELSCGNSGTTIRFLTALCALGQGTFMLDGIARMRARPIGALTGLLKNLGARITHSPEAEGFPPVQVHAHGLAGGILHFGNEASSQFLSAILMVAPYARHEVHIDLAAGQESWPYVAMTMQLMDHFGVTPELIRDPLSGEPKQIIVPQHVYRATDYVIEPDASNASYFLACAAISPGSKVTIEGLGKQSLQGDVGFGDVLHKMGASLIFGKDFLTVVGTDQLNGIEVDLSHMPDTAQTLAAVALFASGPTTIRGLRSLRVKETDRLTALSNELTRLGADVKIVDDALTITPRQTIRPARIETYDDHRMAMSFAVVGTRASGIVIADAECVNKTYPRFFEDLETLRRS